MSRASINKKIDIFTIDELKNNSHEFFAFIKNQNNGVISYVLKKLGKLENNNLQEPLIKLYNKSDEKIRSLSIKNLAKIRDSTLTNFFVKCANTDKSTEVKREAVSAIGRMRDEKNMDILLNFLNNEDPKIVIQAIRGLLSLRNKEKIKPLLKTLINHPNEVIQEVISKEINGSSYKSKSNQKHDEFPSFIKNTIVYGDVQETIKYIPDESIHLTFTSPPYYNARDYSIYQSYGEYLLFLEQVFKEVYRITKEGRFFVLNTSPIIIPRVSRAHSSKRYSIPYDIHPLLIKMGWEFIDDIVWVKPEASVKNRNAGFLQHRKPLGYKPNAITEILMVYRKKTDKLIDWNIKQYDKTIVEESKIKGDYESSNIWKIDPTFDKTHSAVFPLELCDRVIQFYSFKGDLVFDPFAGSGTLGKSAMKLGRYFFLTEKENIYIERMKQDLLKNKNLFNLNKKEATFIDLTNFISLTKG